MATKKRSKKAAASGTARANTSQPSPGVKPTEASPRERGEAAQSSPPSASSDPAAALGSAVLRILQGLLILLVAAIVAAIVVVALQLSWNYGLAPFGVPLLGWRNAAGLLGLAAFLFTVILLTVPVLRE